MDMTHEELITKARNAFIGYNVDAMGIQGAAAAFDTMLATVRQEAREEVLNTNAE